MKSNSKNDFNLSNLPQLIHQASLGPHLEPEYFDESLNICKHFDLGGICTSLAQIPLAREKLGGKSKTKLIGSISFPFGSDPSFLKKAQAEWAALQGADELDLVPNFFALNEGKADFFAEEIATICEIGLPVRVILNSSNLQINRLSTAIEAALDAGASSLQTGNGFGRAVSNSDIIQIKKLTKERCSLKAVGGIKTLSHGIELLEAGANIIGTSFSKELIQDLQLLKK